MNNKRVPTGTNIQSVSAHTLQVLCLAICQSDMRMSVSLFIRVFIYLFELPYGALMQTILWLMKWPGGPRGVFSLVNQACVSRHEAVD